jgi:hypothetical protein
MQRYVTVMLHEDNIKIDAVKTAMAQIDEFAGFPFSIETSMET